MLDRPAEGVAAVERRKVSSLPGIERRSSVSTELSLLLETKDSAIRQSQLVPCHVLPYRPVASKGRSHNLHRRLSSMHADTDSTLIILYRKQYTDSFFIDV
jgi:hypothetical protein